LIDPTQIERASNWQLGNSERWMLVDSSDRTLPKEAQQGIETIEY